MPPIVEQSGIDETAAIIAWLGRSGLIEPVEKPRFIPLTGGVSSQIWRVERRAGPICVKRALPQLRVADDWFVPVERAHHEAAWLRIVAEIAPEAAPRLLAEDAEGAAFAMDYLDPRTHPVWKAELRDGRVDPGVAAAVGRRLARIHAATAGREDLAQAFAGGAEIFRLIRLEPYFTATAQRHPDLAASFAALVEMVATVQCALVHGDVSPKNLLIGPAGPVFLDAECASYGDPAFDLAFCLNHLLLKCLWRPAGTVLYLAAFDALASAYLDGVRWEAAAVLEARSAAYLPGLLLARVDGKSPVEYLTAARDRDRIRQFARALFAAAPTALAAICALWTQELAA